MEATERLYKSRDDKVISGVSGGIAEYFDIDPVLVRVAWVVLTVATGGVALLVYIVMAFVTPEDQTADVSNPTASDSPASDEPETSRPSRRERRLASRRRGMTGRLIAAGLIAIGTVMLLNNLGLFGAIRWDIVWPVAIILLGLAILLPRLRG